MPTLPEIVKDLARYDDPYIHGIIIKQIQELMPTAKFIGINLDHELFLHVFNEQLRELGLFQISFWAGGKTHYVPPVNPQMFSPITREWGENNLLELHIVEIEPGEPTVLIAFDIDGTIADLTHRLHLIKDLPDDVEPNWYEFFKQSAYDKPIPEMIQVLNALNATHNVDIIFVSGRSDSCRAVTEAWLQEYTQIRHCKSRPDEFVNLDLLPLLYMRTNGDHRPDYKVKRDLLNLITADYGVAPTIAFDDRQQVVDMWRANDIRCCQVAKGDF